VEVLEAQAATLVGERGKLFQALSALAGVEVFESRANFILFRVSDAPRVFAGLKNRGVLIKNLHGGHPLLNHCLRVTVGAPEENEAFMTALAAELDH
jgi:histidinol-phosphate aminotransferase